MLQIQYYNKKLNRSQIDRILNLYNLKYSTIKNEIESKMNDLISGFLKDILAFLENIEEVSQDKQKITEYDKLKNDYKILQNKYKEKEKEEKKVKRELGFLNNENYLLKYKFSRENIKNKNKRPSLSPTLKAASTSAYKPRNTENNAKDKSKDNDNCLRTYSKLHKKSYFNKQNKLNSELNEDNLNCSIDNKIENKNLNVKNSFEKAKKNEKNLKPIVQIKAKNNNENEEKKKNKLVNRTQEQKTASTLNTKNQKRIKKIDANKFVNNKKDNLNKTIVSFKKKANIKPEENADKNINKEVIKYITFDDNNDNLSNVNNDEAERVKSDKKSDGCVEKITQRIMIDNQSIKDKLINYDKNVCELIDNQIAELNQDEKNLNEILNLLI